MADLSTFSTICFIISLYLYYNYFINANPRSVFITTNFILWIVNVSFMLLLTDIPSALGISDKLFCLLNFGFYSFIAELNYMPIMNIWCAICPSNLEATSITLFTGLCNFTYNFSNYFGAFIIWAMNIGAN